MTEHEKLVEIIVSTDLGKSSGRLMDAYNIADNLLANGVRVLNVGEWKYNSGAAHFEKSYFCSICKEGESDYGNDNFCSHCGSRMIGGNTTNV